MQKGTVILSGLLPYKNIFHEHHEIYLKQTGTEFETETLLNEMFSVI